MNAREALLAALHFLIVAAFFGGGIFFICLAYLPHLKELFFESCTEAGLSLLLIALLLTLGFYALDRGRYLVIRMGITTDMQFVRQTVEESLHRTFSNKLMLRDVGLGPKSRLEISVTLAPLDEEAQEALYIAAEKHLSTLLSQRFGYAKPFTLIVKL